MSRTLTEDQSVKLAQLLILMAVPKEMRLDIITAIETPEQLANFLSKLSKKNYEMTPKEVYRASVSTIEESLLKEVYSAPAHLCKLAQLCLDKKVPAHTITKYTEQLQGKPTEERDKIIEQLIRELDND